MRRGVRHSAFGIRKKGWSAEKKEWGGPWVGSRGHRVRIVGPSCSREGGGLRYIDDAMVRNRVENEGGARRATQVAFAGASGSCGSWSRCAEPRLGHATRRREEEEGKPRPGSWHEDSTDVAEPTSVARPGQDARDFGATPPAAESATTLVTKTVRKAALKVAKKNGYWDRFKDTCKDYMYDCKQAF